MNNNRTIIYLDVMESDWAFIQNYNKITVKTKCGKPVTIGKLISIASDIYQPEKLTIELIENLIITHASDVFHEYDVSFEGSFLKLNGVVVFDLNKLKTFEKMDKYINILSDSYHKQSDFEFVKQFISTHRYDLDWNLKVKPKNKLIRWFKSLY